MSNPQKLQAASGWLRELPVPAIFMLGVAAYGYDAGHLSAEAMLLPIAIMAVVAGALAWALIDSSMRQRAGAAMGQAQADGGDIGPILEFKPWMLILIPVAMFLVFDQIGALPVLFAIVFASQMLFSRRRIMQSLLISAAVTAPTYALFKYFLYVRFPLGVLGVG